MADDPKMFASHDGDDADHSLELRQQHGEMTLCNRHNTDLDSQVEKGQVPEPARDHIFIHNRHANGGQAVGQDRQRRIVGDPGNRFGQAVEGRSSCWQRGCSC